MNCTVCGAKLPPGVGSCPVCGAATPYNVTGQPDGSSQYDPTYISYKGNPPTPSTPYGGGNPPATSYPYTGGNPPTPSYGANPPTPSVPYNNTNMPPPPTEYGAPMYGASGTTADPYNVPVVDPYSQPGNAYTQRQQQTYTPPVVPTMQPPPAKKSGRGRILALVIIAVVVVLVAAGIIGAVAVNNTNVQHANATATAQSSNATATAITQTKNLTATAVAVTTTYPFSNNLKLNDPLKDNSKGLSWDEGTNNTGGACTFTGQSYHASEKQTGYFDYCMANNTHFANFTYEIEMMVAQGDAGGLLFRGNTSGQVPSFYYFRMNQDGTYHLFLYVDSTGTNARTLAHGSAAGFNTGLNQTNLLAVVVRGSSISLYANKQLITTVTDSTYTAGQIGITADYINGPTEVVYTNAKVWQLP